MQISFEWDQKKAKANLRKHGTAFEEASTLFLDPLAQSFYDGQHSSRGERWVTQGRATSERVLVVIHTFTETSGAEAQVRIISARPATRRERRQYEEA